LALYEVKIRKCPEGAISIKNISGRQYAYLAKRNGDKILTEYIGKINSPEVNKLIENIQERKKYAKLAVETKDKIKEILKVIGNRKQIAPGNTRFIG